MIRLLHRFVVGFGMAPRPPVGPTHAVFVRIDEPLMPLQRGRKYEDPLDRRLRRAGLGWVTGGGSVQRVGGGIGWVSLDLQLVAGPEALGFVACCLRELGAPPGAVLRYRQADEVVTVPVW